MAMFKPAHPGEILREEIIEALGLSVTVERYEDRAPHAA